MIGYLQPYPAMKDSGVRWFGEVPEHWDLRRLRNAADLRVSNVDKHAKEGEQRVRLCNYVDVYKRERIRSDQSFMAATATPAEIDRFRLEYGDVLITKDSESWDDIGVPALVEGPARDLVSGYHLAILRPYGERISGAYLLRALQSNAIRYQFHVEAKGVTRYGLSHAAIKSVWLPIPSLPEQAAIVRFLDHADQRILRYIRAKQKMIELLEEQKQAIIRHGVTRGLDPNVPLKDSGLAWCPQVPAHWEMKPNRTFLRQRKVLVGEHHPEYTLLSLTKQGVIIRDLTDNKGKFSSDMGTHQEVRQGDLVMCLFDVPETPRTVGLSPHDGMITGAYTIFEVSDRDVARWLERFYIAMDDGKLLSPLYSGLRNTIPKPRFIGARTPLPPVAEREEILRTIEQMVHDVDAAISRAGRQVELLGEYRARLITEVVTGRLDVRDAVTHFPDESEESQPLDGAYDLLETAEELEPASEEAEV